MKQNAVGWFEIYVQDMQRARQFYEAVFEVELEKLDNPMMEMYGFPMLKNATGATGALAHREGVPSGGNSILIYFNCEDCALQLGRVADNGGTLVCDKFSIGEYGFIGIAKDTEGNSIGLHSTQ